MVISSSVGNVDNEIELGIYKAKDNKHIARLRLMAIRVSTITVGNGKMIKEMIITSNSAKNKSL
mgnify:CR=1 FL=1